jgi:hypothetical protein
MSTLHADKYLRLLPPQADNLPVFTSEVFGHPVDWSCMHAYMIGKYRLAVKPDVMRPKD